MKFPVSSEGRFATFHFVAIYPAKMLKPPGNCHYRFPSNFVGPNETMKKSGLKGQPILAQGKAIRGSVALGLSRATEIDREPARI